ncbi:MAG: hypothetical protein HC896_12320 [Bacteroidales bacterium]|nr:hypothetical protein [Bacteroidales bacterium]
MPKALSHTIIRIAFAAIVISQAAMLLSIAVIRGFKSEITAKVTGFNAHIQITNFDANKSFETAPVLNDTAVYKAIMASPNVKNIQPYAIKAGIIKTKQEILGVVVKGINQQYDLSFFKKIPDRRKYSNL